MNELYRQMSKAGNKTACRAIETRWLAEMRAVLREEEIRPREPVDREWLECGEAEYCYDEYSELYWKCECECFCWERDVERSNHGRKKRYDEPVDASDIFDDSKCRACLCGFQHEPPTEAELAMRERKGIPVPSH